MTSHLDTDRRKNHLQMAHIAPKRSTKWIICWRHTPCKKIVPNESYVDDIYRTKWWYQLNHMLMAHTTPKVGTKYSTTHRPYTSLTVHCYTPCMVWKYNTLVTLKVRAHLTTIRCILLWLISTRTTLSAVCGHSWRQSTHVFFFILFFLQG